MIMISILFNAPKMFPWTRQSVMDDPLLLPPLVLRPSSSSTSSFVIPVIQSLFSNNHSLTLFRSFLINISGELFSASICRHYCKGNQKSRNSFRYNFSLGDLQIKAKYHRVRFYNKCFKINGIVTHAKILFTHDENGRIRLDNQD